MPFRTASCSIWMRRVGSSQIVLWNADMKEAELKGLLATGGRSERQLHLLSGVFANVDQENLQLLVDGVDFELLHRDYIAEPLLYCTLNQQLRSCGENFAIGTKHHLKHAATEVGQIHPLARIGEEELVDHVADMVVGIGPRRASAAIKIKRKIKIFGHEFLRNGIDLGHGAV